MPIPERYWEIIVAIAAPSTPNCNTITKNKSNTILSIAAVSYTHLDVYKRQL